MVLRFPRALKSEAGVGTLSINTWVFVTLGVFLNSPTLHLPSLSHGNVV